MARADAWFEQARHAIGSKQPLADQLAAQVAGLPGATLKSWMAESCIGSYPLEVVGGSDRPMEGPPAAGAFLVLSMELTIDGAPWASAAPVFVRA